MKEQLHKRMPKDAVIIALKSFIEKQISEVQICDMLQIKRSQLYLYVERLKSGSKEDEFTLYAREHWTKKISPEEENYIIDYLRYVSNLSADERKFNFALISEEAEKRFNKKFHRNTIRRIAIRDGLYTPHNGESGKVFKRFESGKIGLMFQHDSSIHRWIPAIPKNLCLIGTIDDHSRMLVGVSLFENESAWNHILHIKKISLKYGIPVQYYVDNHSIFKYIASRDSVWKKTKKGDKGITQVQKLLERLNTNFRYAPIRNGSAKGKIEKKFDYLQRRIPFLCKKYNISNAAAALPIIEDVLDYYNFRRINDETKEIPYERWKNAEVQGRSAIRHISVFDADLDFIFSLHFERVVRRDGTVSFNGSKYKTTALPGSKITVCHQPSAKASFYLNSDLIYKVRFS